MHYAPYKLHGQKSPTKPNAPTSEEPTEVALLRDSIAATVAKTWLHQEHVLIVLIVH